MSRIGIRTLAKTHKDTRLNGIRDIATLVRASAYTFNKFFIAVRLVERNHRKTLDGFGRFRATFKFGVELYQILHLLEL